MVLLLAVPVCLHIVRHPRFRPKPRYACSNHYFLYSIPSANASGIDPKSFPPSPSHPIPLPLPTHPLNSPLTSPYPSPVFSTTATFPFGSATSVLPFTLTGTTLYTHLATKKLVTAQTQTMIARLTVMKSVGTSTSSATPIQKSEKRRAVMSERKRTPREKERKSAMGVKERMSWERRKVFGVC